MQKEQIKQLVDRITGTQIKEPNPRVKAIIDRMLLDLFNASTISTSSRTSSGRP